MIAIKMGEDRAVRWVNQCRRCTWIDPVALDGWLEAAFKERMTERAQRIAVASETQPFAFVQRSDEELTLREILYQSLGAASACWENLSKAGQFDSSRAKAIGEALEREVEAAMERSWQFGHDAAIEKLDSSSG